MFELPAVYRTFAAQLLFALVLPLFFFVFVLIYRPFGMEQELLLGNLSFGVNLTLMSCILFGVVALMRLFLYLLRRRIGRLSLIVWSLGEITVAALFVGLYAYLMEHRAEPYFLVVAQAYGWLFPVLIFPYALLMLALDLRARLTAPLAEPAEDQKMRFYDEHKNLKLVVTATSVLYISAEENYVNIYYLEGDRMCNYLLRNSMKSIEELCLAGGLVRCHRSFYLNPRRVKALRKEREGQIVAQLDVVGAREIPVTKRYYDAVAEQLQ